MTRSIAPPKRVAAVKILMLTNTFAPHVGGVAASVQRFTNAYREMGHQVLVGAPWFKGHHADEPGVLRVPAWEHIWDSDFSWPLPLPARLHARVHDFAPQIIHSHHPFLLGATALRLAASLNVPIVFTHHTQYDLYSHYFSGDSELVRRFASQIAIGYANLCDAVIAPSESMQDLLAAHGVTSRLEVVPTGVDLDLFAAGQGERFRQEHGLPQDALIVGHVGRLAMEKNLEFLCQATADFLTQHPHTWMVVAGDGPLAGRFTEIFAARQVAGRLVMPGVLAPSQLCDAYAAMDLFVFSSKSETQGLVLTEAMAAGTPVVAIDAPGVREVVRDGVNGRLLPVEDPHTFVAALCWFAQQTPPQRQRLKAAARHTAAEFAMPRCAARGIALYAELIEQQAAHTHRDDRWHSLVRRIVQECRLWGNVAEAGTSAVLG